MSALAINGRFLTQRVTGVQRYANEMAAQIIGRYPDAMVIRPHSIRHPDLAARLNAQPMGKMSGYVWEQISFPYILRARCRRPLLVNLANIGPLAYSNSLLVLHDVGFLRHPEWYSRSFGSVYRYLVPRLTRTYRQIVTDSEFSRQELMSVLNLDPGKVAVVPCGVSPQFSPADTPADRNTRPYILAVSSLDPKKNFRRLIDAFAALRLADYRLVCVGGGHRAFSSSGPYPNRRLESVEFTGYISDEKLIEIYRGATLFVYPSLYEGFGLPPLEAMACGCPCVVARSASLPEVCGDAVVYCDPDNTDDIADAMRKTLCNPALREQLISLGCKQAASYTWSRAGDAMAAVLEKM